MVFVVGTDAAAPRTAVAASMSVHTTAGDSKHAEGGILSTANTSAVALAFSPYLAAVDFNGSRVDVTTVFLTGADARAILAAVGLDITALDDDGVDAGSLSATYTCAVAAVAAASVITVAICTDNAARNGDVAAFAAFTSPLSPPSPPPMPAPFLPA